MSHPHEPPQDDLVDEVRAIRRGIVAECGHAVDRLCDHLNQVAAEFRAGAGRFAGLSSRSADAVTAAWGHAAHDTRDPLLDEVRSIRRELTPRRT